MLPTELLLFRVKAGLVEPRRLKPTTNNLRLWESKPKRGFDLQSFNGAWMGTSCSVGWVLMIRA